MKINDDKIRDFVYLDYMGQIQEKEDLEYLIEIDYQNELLIIGNPEQVLEVRDYIKGDSPDMYIDFNKIEKMPEELAINGLLASKILHKLIFGTIDFYFDRHYQKRKLEDLTEDDKKEGLELVLKFQSNFEKYGCPYGVWWRWKNWGCPINAYSQKLISENDITFSTDFIHAGELIRKLSEIFPNVRFKYYYLTDRIYEYMFSKGKMIYEIECYEKVYKNRYYHDAPIYFGDEDCYDENVF